LTAQYLHTTPPGSDSIELLGSVRTDTLVETPGFLFAGNKRAASIDGPGRKLPGDLFGLDRCHCVEMKNKIPRDSIMICFVVMADFERVTRQRPVVHPIPNF